MALSKEVEAAVEGLIELGVLNEDGLKRLGSLLQGLKAFSGASISQSVAISRPPRKGYYPKTAPELRSPQAGTEAEREPGKPLEGRKTQSQLEDQKGSTTPTSGVESLEDHDPEFTHDLPGEYGGASFEARQAPRKPIPGFIAGYSSANLQKEPLPPRPRAPKGSFNPSREELESLREVHTVKQIATLNGVSPATVNLRLRELGLTDPGRRRKAARR